MNIAILLAAGSGERMNMNISKQFILVNDIPLFIFSAKTFNDHPKIDSLIIVTKIDDIQKVEDFCKEYKIDKLSAVIPGGKTRQDSVYEALSYLNERIDNDDVVLIHDTARPLISKEIIDENLRAIKDNDAIETAIKAEDTIIKSGDGSAVDYIENRETIYQVQTPQSFRYRLIYYAHLKAKEEQKTFTDDASLILALNKKVSIVKGSKRNFKVTTSDDLNILKGYLKSDLDDYDGYPVS